MEYIYAINEKISKFKYIIIYGAGSSGQNLLSCLMCDNIMVNFFCDSDSKKWGKYILGKKILSPDELYKIEKESAILIASMYTKEIVEKLTKANIKNLFITRQDTFGGFY